MHDNVTSLNSFLQSCIQQMKEYPPVFLAFLESGIVRRSNGYDIVKNSDGNIEFISTNENNLQVRLPRNEKFDIVSMRRMLSGQIGPLNLLEDRVNRFGSMFSSKKAAPNSGSVGGSGGGGGGGGASDARSSVAGDSI